MSQRRTLEYVFLGNTRGFEAAQNRIFSGLNRISTQGKRTSQDLGLIDRQLMAIGTTARYALAGSLVFGLTGAIARLTEFKNQLGVVAGLAGNVNQQTGAYRPASGGFLSDVGNEAMLTSNRVGIAVNDVQEYMNRFFSAFDPPGGQKQRLAAMRAFVDEAARLQALMGAEAGDPQQLAGGLAGMVNQIPGGRQNIGRTTNRVANLIAEMTRRTPNITGRDVARDIGRVGATMFQTGMTPEQAFAVWTQAGMAGGSSAVIGRGVSQLLGTSLLRPGPQQQAAYRSIGLSTDPNVLRQMGAFKVLQTMLDKARTGTIRSRRPGALSNENIDDPEAAINAAGTSGINLKLIYGLFGRQESARQFVNLLAQDGTKGLKNFLASMQKVEKANTVRAREQEAINQRTLARFGQARGNISLALARGAAWPLENVVAPPIIGASNLLAGHTRVREAATAAIGVALLAGGLRKLIRGRGLISGKGAAGAALAAEAAPNLLAGMATPTGARDNPLWVIIHPASAYVGGGTGGGGMPGGGGVPTPGGKSSWLKRLFPYLGTATVGTMAAYGAAVVAGQKYVINPLTGTGSNDLPSFFGWNGGNPFKSDFGARAKALQNADQLLKQRGILGAHDIRISGKADADLTIRLVDKDGRTITIQEHKGVPFAMTGASMPTSQGKKGSRKN